MTTHKNYLINALFFAFERDARNGEIIFYDQQDLHCTWQLDQHLKEIKSKWLLGTCNQMSVPRFISPQILSTLLELFHKWSDMKERVCWCVIKGNV